MALLIIVISAVTFVVWAIHEGTKNTGSSFDDWDNNENLGL